MAGFLTLDELDAAVAASSRRAVERMGKVEWDGRYGDWDGWIRRQRALVAILHEAHAEIAGLQPPPERAAAFRAFLEATDRQLDQEDAVLAAIEARDPDRHREETRKLVPLVGEVRVAGRAAGLRCMERTMADRARLWLRLPVTIVRAQAFARAEHRAGRRWSDDPLPVPQGAVFLTMLFTTVSVDWALKSIAHAQHSVVSEYHFDGPLVLPALASLVMLLVTLRASIVPPVSWTWNYGAGLAWGGTVASVVEVLVRGRGTNFINLGDHGADTATLAMVIGLALWWGGAVCQLILVLLRRSGPQDSQR